MANNTGLAGETRMANDTGLAGETRMANDTGKTKTQEKILVEGNT